MGDVPAALEMSARLEEIEARPYVFGWPTLWRAFLAAELGERDEAVRLLNLAYREGMPHGVWLRTAVFLESLRGYPPFERFIEPKG